MCGKGMIEWAVFDTRFRFWDNDSIMVIWVCCYSLGNVYEKAFDPSTQAWKD